MCDQVKYIYILIVYLLSDNMSTVIALASVCWCFAKLFTGYVIFYILKFKFMTY